MERKRKIPSLVNRTHLCSASFYYGLSIFILIFSSRITTASTIPYLDTKCPMFTKANTYIQEKNGKIGESRVSGGKKHFLSMSWPTRRLMGGPGSSPPRCTSKCGKCTPCKPVHVPMPPGTPVTAKYYPETGRCKCGNKL